MSDIHPCKGSRDAVTWKEYVDQRFRELDQRMAERQHLTELAIAQNESVINSRLAEMNNFRQALTDQAKNFITRAEHDRLDMSVRELERSKSNLDGRIQATVIAVSALISFVMSGVLIILSHFWPDVPMGK